MPEILPPLRLTGATVLAPDGLQDRTVAIAGGRIARGPFPAVDLDGCLILPGIIDLGSDALENRLRAGPDPDSQVDQTLDQLDRAAAAGGVTTTWIAQAWSWEGGIRSPDFAETVAAALDRYRAGALTDLRLQIRYETHTHDAVDRLMAMIRRHGIGYVLFGNLLDEAALPPFADALAWAARARRLGLAPAALTAAANAARARAKEVPQRLCRLADCFDSLGVLYGSHGDADAETRDYHAMIGARICAFPASAQAAAVARALNDPIVLSAPDILGGGARAGRISAATLVARGKCDALASEGDPAALAAAAFRLVDDGLLTLPRAWALISTRAAQVMRLSDRGVIEPGRRADLCIVDKATRRVEATIAGGRMTHLSGRAAERFRGSGLPGGIAAE